MSKTVKEMTCIVCPVGCRMKVSLDENGKVVGVEGNTCKRGEKYAVTEITNPVRTLTSSVRIKGAGDTVMLPVKTSLPIPKGRQLEGMRIIKAITVSAPLRAGDIIVKDFLVSGVNLIAGKDVELGR